MADKKNFSLHDPYPTTLNTVREQIDYWASEQNKGYPESIHEVSVKNRLEHLRELERRFEHQDRKRGDTIFISCGQVTAEEIRLGVSVSSLVNQLTRYRAYFAENQSSLEGLSKNILEALNNAVGLVAIMHPRGRVVSPGRTEHTRGSLWIEQEIAIAAFMVQVLKRPIAVKAYIHRDIGREGIRDQLHLNPFIFTEDEEILNDLQDVLPTWENLATSNNDGKSAGIAEPWEPTARIDHSDHQNSLVLRSDREFGLHRVYVMGPTGAVMQELPKSSEWETLRSRGYRISIPKEALTNVWNNSGGPRDGRTSASIGYELLSDGKRAKFSIPVMLSQEFYVEGSTHCAWVKATG